MHSHGHARIVLTILLAAGSTFLGPSNVGAQWPAGGIPTSAVAIPTDGAGGVWVITGLAAATRISGSGVAIASAGQTGWTVAGPLGAVPDGSGGFVVVGRSFQGGSAEDISASRSGADGVNQWGPAGIVVCNASNKQLSASVTADGVGGYIVAWKDWRVIGAVNQTFTQKLNGAGAPQWPANGVVVCSQDVTSDPLQLVPDGSGGAIFCWEDKRFDGNNDLFAQRMTAAGAPAWAVNGIPICTVGGPQLLSKLVPDGAGGAIIVWQDGRTGTNDLLAQRIDGNGTLLWGANGVVVSSAIGNQNNPQMVSDGTGGAFVVWEDYRGVGDIYGQHIDASGASLWTVDGLPICTAANLQLLPQLASDGGGIVVAWGDQRSSSTRAYIQRLSAAGAAQWISNGSEVGTDGQPIVTSDGSAGGFVASPNLMRVPSSGEPAWIPNYRPSVTQVVDEPADQGGYAQIHFTKPLSDGPLSPATTGYFIWRKVPGTSGTGTARVIDWNGVRGRRDLVTAAATASPWMEFPPGSWVAIAYFPATQSATYSFLVPTHNDSTAAGAADDAFIAMGYCSPTLSVLSAPVSGHSVDNLAPGAPQALAGGRTGNTSVHLAWTPGGESDLWHYTVYRGDSPAFVPSSANRIGQPTTAAWDDNAFEPNVSHYKVSATDRHGNESSFAALGPLDIVSVPLGQVPTVSYLGRPAPNPFGDVAVVEYGLASPGRMSLAVFGPDGRLVARLVEGPENAGVRRVQWSGRDEKGHRVRQGVYVIRLILNGQSYSQKLAKLN